MVHIYRKEVCDQQQWLHTSVSAAARAAKRPRCPDPYQAGYVETRGVGQNPSRTKPPRTKHLRTKPL